MQTNLNSVKSDNNPSTRSFCSATWRSHQSASFCSTFCDPKECSSTNTDGICPEIVAFDRMQTASPSSHRLATRLIAALFTLCDTNSRSSGSNSPTLLWLTASSCAGDGVPSHVATIVYMTAFGVTRSTPLPLSWNEMLRCSGAAGGCRKAAGGSYVPGTSAVNEMPLGACDRTEKHCVFVQRNCGNRLFRCTALDGI